MAERQWSKYQLAIFDTYQNTKNNIVIEATSGAGKSSTLIELSKRTPSNKRTLFMAFNKSIAEELREKLPENIEVATFHSKGLKTLLQNMKIRFKVSENKCFQIGKMVLEDLEDSFDDRKKMMKYLFDLQTIWSFLRQMLSVDYAIDIPSICFEKDIEFRERMVDDIKEIEKEWLAQLKRKSFKPISIDFTDMLWLPYILIPSENFPKYNIVFTDEAQDSNVLQREMILNYIKKGGRLVAVGDSQQCLYFFMGSTVAIFDSYKRMENTSVLPLSISYRCDKRIVEEAKKVFPDKIEASSFTQDGIVRKGDFMEAQDGDFILCRNNLPLVQVFIDLLKKQKRSTIKGKDFGENLIEILDKISRPQDLACVLEEKMQSLLEKGIPRGIAINHPSYIALQEKCDILALLLKEGMSVNDLKDQMGNIFTDEENDGIVLSTIHKSKGLEADRVFFLNENLIPSPRATTPGALYSEKCLRFVAITRARHELIYCNI